MKLLIVSHPCVTSVNQQFYAEVERQTNWDLTIVTPSNWKNEYGSQLNPERWHEYKGKLLTIPVWQSGSIPLHTYRSAFITLLRELTPDFIYLHHEPYAIATAQVYLANHLSIKRPIGFFSWQNIFKRYPTPFRQIERWILQESSCAFPGSISAQEVLRQKGYQGRCTILPSGIDVNMYFPRPDANELKEKLQDSSNEVLIGYVGRIVEEKGLKTLLNALERIKHLAWKLIVVGSGLYETEFDEIARSLQLSDRITRLGYIPHTETPRYLSAFDILVLPSETRPNWKEQFGRVSIEAIACGTPVVGSDSGEIPYLLQATGGGLVFPEGQPELLADRLQQLICAPELRSRLATKARQIVLSDYTSSALVERFVHTVELAVKSKNNASG